MVTAAHGQGNTSGGAWGGDFRFSERHTLRVCNVLHSGAAEQSFTLLCVHCCVSRAGSTWAMLPKTPIVQQPSCSQGKEVRQLLVQGLCEEQNPLADIPRAQPAAATHRAAGRLWRVAVQLWHSSKHHSGWLPAAWQSNDD